MCKSFYIFRIFVIVLIQISYVFTFLSRENVPIFAILKRKKSRTRPEEFAELCQKFSKSDDLSIVSNKSGLSQLRNQSSRKNAVQDFFPT